MKHLIRLAALMTAAAIFALPLGAQSRGHSSGHGSASHSSASHSYSNSGPSHSSSSPSRSSSSASIGSSHSHHSSPASRSLDRPAGGSSIGRSSGSSHSGSVGSSHSGGNKHSGSSASDHRPSHDGATAHHPSAGSSHSGDVQRPSGHSGSNHHSSGHVAVRPSNGGHPNGGHRPSGHVAPRPAPGARPYAEGHRPAPAHMGRVHVNHHPGYHAPRPARHRELHGSPIRFSHHGHHCYGHYLLAPPPHYIHRVYHGIDYYFWDDIWYRYYAGRYWVCRPPFGYVFTPLADAVLTAIALNALTEETSAPVAKSLNLIRSYAAEGTEYFYNDGVFYIKGEDGQYVVIVPPAGALVDTLPDDYEIFEFEGNTYYKVDDTVYQMTVTEDGKACFEVLGQLAE